jgi:glutamate dehydrogenase/leucine dehydrogenase
VYIVFSKTRFTTCISPSLGGSGNPSVPTALGVKVSMEGALHALHGMQQVASPSLEGKVVAVQGLGNVGFALVGYLLEAGVKRVIGADISEKRVADALAQYDDTGKVYFRVESRDTPVQDSILSEECDILSPCGFGGILNANTVPHIKAKIVCGAANNQLLDSREDYGMSERGITYVPDFVCNRMGIVNCANEQYGSVGEMGSSKDPMIARHLDHQWEHSVFTITDSVIHNAHKHGTSTDAAARIMADQYAQQEHPVMGHRTADIIRSLEEDGWAK